MVNWSLHLCAFMCSNIYLKHPYDQLQSTLAPQTPCCYDYKHPGVITRTAAKSPAKNKYNNNNNNNDDDDLLTDPLGGSALLNYVNYNYKINQTQLCINYAVQAGLTEYNYSKTD